MNRIDLKHWLNKTNPKPWRVSVWVDGKSIGVLSFATREEMLEIEHLFCTWCEAEAVEYEWRV